MRSTPTHFTSDQHFGHQNIISFCGRPFDCLEHMHAQLIDRYNATVGVGDTVVWVGDAFFCAASAAAEYLDRLNGRKILVRGNHDRKDICRLDGWDLVVDEIVLDLGGQSVRVNHYPPWVDFLKPGQHRDRFAARRPRTQDNQTVLYGHTHSKLQVDPKHANAIHVGVDAWDFAPAPVSEIVKLIKGK